MGGGGDHEGSAAQPTGLVPNGLLPGKAAGVTRVFDPAKWARAEERTAELIARILPSPSSEERRNAVANYMQRLISKCFACEVFTFGSVPLKTYLPDGDIDLTTFSFNESLKDTWAIGVRDMLQNEERSDNAEFSVKEVQYIQAEVKIVKCLVENIVVDISFNQLGGLCTLCFLEEIDRLIDQNHLFKRSIILIKAWCYYESRILGAHHGLISTYALETLVLYIFHIFNNSFVGPLEVLYRFLEFFSNFDWENFCLSLWGPVPISSLPDATPNPPLKDCHDLLLTPHILNATSIYAVVQPGQESHNQPFVSKYFNVIDPLRTNNNLGRSVNKGNFFRIRSAFSFGAQKLARLLECSKENLIPELNLFFLNTWQRHGSRYPSDALVRDLLQSPPSNLVPTEESNVFLSTTSTKKKSENVILSASQEHNSHSAAAFQRSSLPVVNSVGQHSMSTYRSNSSVALSRTQSQKVYETQTNYGPFDPLERNRASIHSDKSKKVFKSDYSNNEQQLSSHLRFARTRSNPELTDTSGDVSSRGRRNKMTGDSKDQIAHSRLDLHGKRHNFGPEASVSSSALSLSDDHTLPKQSSSHESFETSGGLTSISNNHHSDAGFTSMGEEHVCDDSEIQQDMQQEEQDLMNMRASSHVMNANEQILFPMHLAPHWHLPLPPFLASLGYGQRSVTGVVPTNVPLVEASWAPNMQFPHGIVSSPMMHYFPAVGQNFNPDDATESGNESSGMTDVPQEDDDNSFWHEDDTNPSGTRDLDNGGLHKHHVDDRQQANLGGHGFIPSLRTTNPGAPMMPGHQKFARESRVAVREDNADSFQHTNIRNSDIHPLNRSANLRSSSFSHSSSPRNKSISDGARDGSFLTSSKTGRERWGRKSTSSAIMTHLYGKPRNEWQFDGVADHGSAEENNDTGDGNPSSVAGNNLVERTSGPASVISHTRNLNVVEYETEQKSSDAVIPMPPMLVGSSNQGTVDNSTVLPLTFFPTGPPVPFLTMLPLYNFHPDAGNPGRSSNQHERDGVAHSHVSQSGDNISSAESLSQSEALMTSTASSSDALETTEGHKTDILNSDFAIHWQNLQYGRSCQNTPFPGSSMYPPPLVVPPLYLQGHFPLEGPGRPSSSNGNIVAQPMNCGPRLVPVAPLQPGPVGASSVFHRFGEAPRFRGGTGTYLPNPKATFRDHRSMSSPRNHRGPHNHDRNDNDDREGSWIHSKQRGSSRSHGRHQSEKPPGPRTDRLNAPGNRPDRSWDAYRHKPDASSHEARTSSFGSANLAYGGMYPMPVMGPNGGGGGVVMLYPFGGDHGLRYDSSAADAAEFAAPSGQVHPMPTNEAVPNAGGGNPVRGGGSGGGGMFHRGGVSPRSSPDRPSTSPRVQRR